MATSKLEQNILAQAGSLTQVLNHQSGPGAAALAQAAQLLRSGKRILITGMGASLFASIPPGTFRFAPRVAVDEANFTLPKES